MMTFDEFRKKYLDHRVDSGDYSQARAMSHAYLLLAKDEEQSDKAKAFREVMKDLMEATQ